MAFLRVLSLVLLVGLAAECHQVCTTCLPEWTYYDGSCYRFFETRKTWAKAEQHCQELGPGHLTSICCSEENELINEMWESARGTTEGLLWIGLTDQAEEGTFVWTDGSAVDFTNWREKQPDDRSAVGGEDCGVLSRVNGQWNDVRCTLRSAYICKMAATE